MKKATLATVKSFIKKNINNLYFIEHTAYNGMVDCVEKSGLERKIDPSEVNFDKVHTWGINGIFLASDRNSVTKLENGYSIRNCCGDVSIITK